jgi:hypothetical protein
MIIRLAFPISYLLLPHPCSNACDGIGMGYMTINHIDIDSVFIDNLSFKEILIVGKVKLLFNEAYHRLDVSSNSESEFSKSHLIESRSIVL